MRTRVSTAIVAALTTLVIALVVDAQPVPTGYLRRVETNSPGLLSGSGTVGNPLTATITTGTGLSGTGSAGSPLTATGTGDITDVIAGSGLLGGASSGAATVDVSTGTGITVTGDAVTLNMTGASCSAGQFVSALNSTGTGTCTAETGDISAVTVTDPACAAGSFVANLTGGASSGAAGVGGTCVAEVGDIAGVTAGEGLTGGGTSGTVSIAVNTTISDAGQLLNQRYDNWSPTGLSTSAVIRVTAADNWGSLISGIDAIGAGFPVGHRITVCNTGALQDDGILAFSPENTNSTANNRIWTPNYGFENGQTAVERYMLAPSACVDLLYMTPLTGDSTIKRWVIQDNTRMAHLAVQQLGLFPMSFPAAISGTVENWDPDNALAGCGTGDSCEAGSSLKSSSYTWIAISTVDSTGATIGGLKYTTSQLADGQGPIKYLHNLGPGPVTLTNGSAGSTTINSFNFAASNEQRANVVLLEGDGILLAHYRDTLSWYPIGGKSDYYFDAREVNFTRGALVKGIIPSGGINSTLLVSDADTGITQNRSLLYASDAGATWNTAGANYTNIIGDFTSTATKSGANQLENIAIRAGASGGTTNRALVTTSGTVYLGLGGAMSTFYANATGSHFSGTVSSQGNFKVGSSDFGGTTSFMVTASSGEVFAGDTASSAGSNNVDVITVGDTGTGQATTAKALIKLTDSGTYTTAGGNVAVYGGNFAVTATESAGANVLTNVALRLSATSGDVNQGLWVDDGSAQFDGAVNVDGAFTATASVNRGTITLSGGTGTATVTSGTGCVCTDTTANASVQCSVSSTTLTATGTGTDVIRYLCF